MIDTFVLVKDKQVISPPLVTTREYGRWYEEYFGKYPSVTELYMKAKDKNGQTVLESHPGSKIGLFFDKKDFQDPELQSWFILQNSSMMQKLKKYRLAELRDAIPISVNDDQGRRMLRVYTIKQIECYIRTMMDRSFSISSQLSTSKKVSISDADMDKLIIPQLKKAQKKLF